MMLSWLLSSGQEFFKETDGKKNSPFFVVAVFPKTPCTSKTLIEPKYNSWYY